MIMDHGRKLVMDDISVRRRTDLLVTIFRLISVLRRDEIRFVLSSTF